MYPGAVQLCLLSSVIFAIALFIFVSYHCIPRSSQFRIQMIHILFQNKEENTVQVDLNVQRINVILVRGVSSECGAKVARKVASVTIADLDFSAELGNAQTMRGSLGGVEVSDLTPESLLHRCILAVGELKQSSSLLACDSECKAFSFSFKKVPEKIGPNIHVTSHIASACYAHSTEFLSEISLCAGDFRDYAASAARSIQTAAADAAKEFVTAKKDRSGFGKDSELEAENQMLVGDGGRAAEFQFSLFVCIETPVIVIPRSFNSPDLLVGNLGRITVRNLQYKESNACGMVAEGSLSRVDRVVLDISNVSLYSITLRPQEIGELSVNKTTFDFLKLKTAGTSTPFSSPSHRKSSKRSNLVSLSEDSSDMSHFLLQADSGHNTEWIEILHETGFQLIIDRITDSRRSAGGEMSKLRGPKFQIEGMIAKAIRLELSSQTYNQVLETLNSLSASAKPDPQMKTHVESSSCSSAVFSKDR